jgi:hypothetical protein
MSNPHELAGLVDYRVEAQFRWVPRGGQGCAQMQDWIDHPELESYIRNTLLGSADEVFSITLIDWATLYHVAMPFAGRLDN